MFVNTRMSSLDKEIQHIRTYMCICYKNTNCVHGNWYFMCIATKLSTYMYVCKYVHVCTHLDCLPLFLTLLQLCLVGLLLTDQLQPQLLLD